MARHKSRIKQPEVIAEIKNATPPLVKTEELNDEDYALIAKQCYHNNRAVMIGTYSSVLFKYAVNYSNRWYFVVYNRDEARVHCPLKFSNLNREEIVKFQYYKNRLEVEERIERMRNLQQADKPAILRPHIVALTREEPQPPAPPTELDDATI